MWDLATAGAVIGVVIGLATVAGLALRAVRSIRGQWAPVADFLEDWRGTPGRPGVPPRPGVMERIETLEAAARTVQVELTPNGGGSMRDRVAAIDLRTRADAELLGEHLTFHRNSGDVDPTARVLLTRPDGV